MFNIGDFARLGRVSVRMLRHYDAIGVLHPAHVDGSTGYRSYDAHQLQRLNRLVALKDLGFTLEQVRSVLDGPLSLEELRGMLRLRRAEVEETLAAETGRLVRIEARLRLIESENAMSNQDVIVKHAPAVRVAQLSAVAAGFDPEYISPVIQPLYPRLCAQIEATGLNFAGPSIAYYEMIQETDEVKVHVSFPVTGEPTGESAVEIVDLPAAEVAALIHRGSMETVDESYQALARWVEENGYQATALGREVYLDCPEEVNDWVTELQMPVQK